MRRSFSTRNIFAKRLRCEPLEDRRMLSVAGSDAAIDMFHTQDALFAENAGQWAVGDGADDVYFGYNKGGTQIYFTDDGLEFGLSRTVDNSGRPGLDPAMEPIIADAGLQPGLRDAEPEIESTHFSLSFDGARPTIPVGADMAQTSFNYHLGAQSDWVDGVSTYKTVIYNDLYDGIDLHTFSRHGQMKYEFHVSPQSDYTQIELSYAGIEGLSIASNGSLHIDTELGQIVDEGLYIYQVVAGQEIEVAGRFVLLDNDSYAFSVSGAYDPAVELIIDPNIDWGSYLGGSDGESANGVSTDAAGNVYVCGDTYSSGWGISGGWDTSFSGSYAHDGYLVKLDGTSGAHLWSTYLGGSDYDGARGVSTDAAGNVYVFGFTGSIGWGISGGWQPSYGGGDRDGYVVKLDGGSGAHLWSTYLGGSDDDYASGVSTDAAGNVYVCGGTESIGWGISGGWQPSYGGGGRDGYVVKLDSGSGAHLWSTYMGGSDNDFALGVSTDTQGNIYVCGYTGSSDWGIGGGWQPSCGGGNDGFVVKLSGSGGDHLWSTYLGGSSHESAQGVSTDTQGNVYVCGWTKSSDWGISGGWDSSYGGYRYNGFSP